MKKIFGITALSLLVGTSNCLAADSVSLEQKVMELADQNKMLLERVEQLEEMLSGKEKHEYHKKLAERSDVRTGSEGSITVRLEQVSGAVAAEDGMAGRDGDGSLLGAIKEYVEISGVVEVETGMMDDFNGDKESDTTLATVEVGLDAHISDWSQAHVLFLYEEGEEDGHVVLDEGTITLGNLERCPVYFTAGKMYMPFGSYLTNMISDTLTLELGEINESALLVGFESLGYYGSVYAFNGDLNEIDEDDTIDSFGANIGFANETGDFSYDVGLDWISNMSDTDGVGGFLEDNLADPEIEDYVAGFGAHFLLAYGPFNFFAEYVGALDEFEAGEIDYDNDGAEPEAWGVEIGYVVEVQGKDVSLALSYQGTDEALALELPEDRYLAGVSLGLLENTRLSFEYFHDEDYDENEGGTGNDADAATLQLAVEF
ncbi:MAG: LbtU family siderophore porin [Desulfobulbaceae bacterium]|nr:LbtU family siderophore porin [Desulfobulbaceae bacterium]